MAKMTLDTYIMNLRKTDMQDIAQMFGERIPQSWIKDRMAQRVATIYEQNIPALLPMLSYITIASLLAIFQQKRNGKLPAVFSEEDKELAPFNHMLLQLEYLGLVDYARGKVNIAAILEDALSRKQMVSEEQLTQWNTMELCALGILHAYGMLEKKTFHQIFRECYPELDELAVATYLNRRIAVRSAYSEARMENGTWLFIDQMEEPGRWFHALQSREDIPYRKYSREEYVTLATTGFLNKPKRYDELLTILLAQGMGRKEAESTLRSAAMEHRIHLDIKSASIPNFVKDIPWDTMEDLEQFLQSLMDFLNHNPIWYNKGHSPSELYKSVPPMGEKPRFARSKVESMPSKKEALVPDAGKVLPFRSGTIIGRNDPCPCGSGKKYKNCCGRNN